MFEDRIILDPNICSGKPCIRGTRIMVKNVLGLFAGGYDMQRVLDTYPELTEADIQVALAYVSDLADEVKWVGT